MTDERDSSGRPGGDPDNGGTGEGGMRDPREPNGQPNGQPNGRDPQPRQGFSEPEPGLHRGPRRSRYGRRRLPSDGPGDDVENYLPSFIAGPSNGGAPDHQPHQVHQPHQPQQSHQPQHTSSHQS